MITKVSIFSRFMIILYKAASWRSLSSCSCYIVLVNIVQSSVGYPGGNARLAPRSMLPCSTQIYQDEYQVYGLWERSCSPCCHGSSSESQLEAWPTMKKMLFQAATFLIVSFLGEFIALQDRLGLRLKFWRSRSWWLLTLFFSRAVRNFHKVQYDLRWRYQHLLGDPSGTPPFWSFW